MNHEVRLKIADTVILMRSRFPLAKVSAKDAAAMAIERFDSFFYRGARKPDIVVDIEITDRLPATPGTKPVFITYHFQDNNENWRLLKRGDGYVFKCPLENKKQVMLVNKKFDRVKAYLMPKTDNAPQIRAGAAVRRETRVWEITDLIYDFLQVLLINYFALRKSGVFTHAVGIKDTDGSGLLFAGKSGAGKSTTARLWHKHSKVMVLNDDRVIVRKVNGKFIMHGSPWHGEFSDYLATRSGSAPLKRIFFIYHSPGNIAVPISPSKAFSLLYPALFPTFWDKNSLENIVAFCDDLVKNIRCYSLGFVNDKRVIGFVRKQVAGK